MSEAKITRDMQPWNPSDYQNRHAYVFEFGADLLGLLNAQPGERILDLGCGTGQLAGAIAQTGARVIGLDLAVEMLAQARVNFPAVEFIQGDASNFSLPEPVDAIFSNAALHWVPDDDGVGRSVARALKPGGRFVAELGGHGNIQPIVEALHSVLGPDVPLPWHYPTIGEYSTVLERHGLEIRQAWLFDRPTPVEGEDGMENWLAVYVRTPVAGIPPERVAQIFKAISDVLRPACYRDGVWTLPYRRLRLMAIKPRA
jgi:trans-aconitate methyltransferase